MDFKNEIVLNGKFGPNGLALTNKIDKSFRTGIEATISYQANKHLQFINNSSFNYSRIQEQHIRFTPILTPAIILNQETIYTLRAFTLCLSARYQSLSWIDFANTSSVNAYFLLNSRLQYDVKHFQIALYLNNLTNAHYYNNGYVDYDLSKKYFVQAPTNFYLSFKYSF